MWNLHDKYRGRRVLPTARQMNLIARILNNVTQGTGIKLTCPQLPSIDAPFVIGVDTEWFTAFLRTVCVMLTGNQSVYGEKHFFNTLYVQNASANTHSILRDGALELFGGTQPYIDFHFNNSADDYTARIIEAAEGVLRFVASYLQLDPGTGNAAKIVGNNIQLDPNGSGKHAYLTRHPEITTDDASVTTALSLALQIATVGFCNQVYWRKITNQEGLLFNTNGTLSHKTLGAGAQYDVAAGDHTHAYSTLTGLPTIPTMPDLTDYLQTSDIGVSVQAYNADLAALVASLLSGGMIPHTQVSFDIDGHEDPVCILTIDSSGNLGCSGGKAYNVLVALKNKCTVSTSGNQTTVTFPFPEWASGATKASVLLGTNSDGEATNLAALLTTAPTTDKVLTVKANGTALSWEDAGGTADNPTNKTSLADTYPGSDSADSSSWTSGGSNGLTLTVQTRTMWSGTYLYGFYRTLTFDKTGRLYSASGETRYIIDTPATYNP